MQEIKLRTMNFEQEPHIFAEHLKAFGEAYLNFRKDTTVEARNEYIQHGILIALYSFFPEAENAFAQENPDLAFQELKEKFLENINDNLLMIEDFFRRRSCR